MGRFTKLVGRALRLRCPLCGEGRLFRGFLQMEDRCPVCTTKFEREPGFFLGSIYINYGLTALVTAIGYPILLFNSGIPESRLLIGFLIFVIVFPLLFHRWARSLWLGFDQWHDPRPDER